MAGTKMLIAKSGIAIGDNHGHIVTPRAVPAKQSHKKGVSNQNPSRPTNF